MKLIRGGADVTKVATIHSIADKRRIRNQRITEETKSPVDRLVTLEEDRNRLVQQVVDMQRSIDTLFRIVRTLTDGLHKLVEK